MAAFFDRRLRFRILGTLQTFDCAIARITALLQHSLSFPRDWTLHRPFARNVFWILHCNSYSVDACVYDVRSTAVCFRGCPACLEHLDLCSQTSPRRLYRRRWHLQSCWTWMATNKHRRSAAHALCFCWNDSLRQACQGFEWSFFVWLRHTSSVRCLLKQHLENSFREQSPGWKGENHITVLASFSFVSPLAAHFMYCINLIFDNKAFQPRFRSFSARSQTFNLLICTDGKVKPASLEASLWAQSCYDYNKTSALRRKP